MNEYLSIPEFYFRIGKSDTLIPIVFSEYPLDFAETRYKFVTHRWYHKLYCWFLRLKGEQYV
jgi:hypothetical protein